MHDKEWIYSIFITKHITKIARSKLTINIDKRLNSQLKDT